MMAQGFLEKHAVVNLKQAFVELPEQFEHFQHQTCITITSAIAPMPVSVQSADKPVWSKTHVASTCFCTHVA